MWPFNREKKPKASKEPRVSAHKIELTNGFYNAKSGIYECKSCKNKTETPGALNAHYFYHHSPHAAESFQKKKEYNRSYRINKRATEAKHASLWNKYLDNTATPEERATIDTKIRLEAIKWIGEFFK